MGFILLYPSSFFISVAQENINQRDEDDGEQATLGWRFTSLSTDNESPLSSSRRQWQTFKIRQLWSDMHTYTCISINLLWPIYLSVPLCTLSQCAMSPIQIPLDASVQMFLAEQPFAEKSMQPQCYQEHFNWK